MAQRGRSGSNGRWIFTACSLGALLALVLYGAVQRDGWAGLAALPGSHDSAFEHTCAALVHREYATALLQLETLAKHGDAESAYWLGRMYEAGRGVEQNQTAARKWLEQAAEHRSAFAARELGMMYRGAEGARSDPAAARMWFQRAAMAGDPVGQREVGRTYLDGEGVKIDRSEAYAWLDIAAPQDAAARRLREMLSRAMGPDEIADARALEEHLRLQLPLRLPHLRCHGPFSARS